MTQCTIFDSATGERYVIQTSTPPPRRTIKRAEDILERLKIPLPPSCSQPCSVHVEDRTLHIFLTYAAILMYNVTLNNQHRGMTQFKSLLPNTKTPAALCPWLTEFKHWLQLHERFSNQLLYCSSLNPATPYELEWSQRPQNGGPTAGDLRFPVVGKERAGTMYKYCYNNQLLSRAKAWRGPPTTSGSSRGPWLEEVSNQAPLLHPKPLNPKEFVREFISTRLSFLVLSTIELVGVCSWPK